MGDDELPLSHKIIAFILTLVALPIAFVGTCVPVGALSNGPYILIGLLTFIAVFVAAVIGIAIRTRNPGIRWAIIIQLAVAGIGVAGWGLYLMMH